MKLNKCFEFFTLHDDNFYEYIDFFYDDDEFIRRFYFDYVFLF